MRYCTIRALAVAAAVLFGLSFGLAQTPPGKQPQRGAVAGKHDMHHEAMDACARACSDCDRACESCATHCAQMTASGQAEHLKSLQTCRDCASFCSAAAQIVARHGPFSDLICGSCAEACARCGKACEQHPNDAHMKQCAEECRKCEKACREMVQHMGGGRNK